MAEKKDEKGQAQKPMPQKQAPAAQRSAPKAMTKIIRIAGTDLDGSLPVERALKKIRGVGYGFARSIRIAGAWPKEKKFEDLNDKELEWVKEILKDPAKFNMPAWFLNRRTSHQISSELELIQKQDIEFLKRIRCRRGIRHMYNYKVRGQRTRSCGANVHGRVGQTMGVARKKLMPAKSERGDRGK